MIPSGVVMCFRVQLVRAYVGYKVEYAQGILASTTSPGMKAEPYTDSVVTPSMPRERHTAMAIKPYTEARTVGTL